MLRRGSENPRMDLVRALTSVRKAQIKVNMAIERLKAIKEFEAASRLAALSEILERISLRLETIIVTRQLSGEAVKSLVALSKALETLKIHAPPHTHYAITEVQESLENIYGNLIMEPLELSPETVNSEVEEIIREAFKTVNNKTKTQTQR
ncbi:MAG: hypothetical protein P3X22_007790 [Thermoprotei archaeon]|nr:hypothetical protein [Thermoprotei archaeon]